MAKGGKKHMRMLIKVALIAMTVSGCNARDAMVNLHTDGNGRLSRIVVVKSTGDRVADSKVKVRARENFYRQVPNPRKNEIYHQPAKVYFPPEPLFK